MNQTKFLTILLSIALLQSALPSTTIVQEPIEENTKNIYHDLEKLFMPSILTENDSVKITQETDHGKEFDIKIPKLSNYESYKIIFEIRQDNKKTTQSSEETFNVNETKQSQNIINDNLGKDLCLFSGDQLNPDNNLLHYINRTHTKNGTLQLAKMLFSPTTDIAKLKNRQKIIQSLIINEKLFNKLETDLEQIKKYEDEFLSLWKQFDKSSQQLLDSLFYYDSPGLKIFNTSPSMLEAWHAFVMITTVISVVGMPIETGVFAFLYTNILRNYHPLHVDYNSLIASTIGMALGMLLVKPLIDMLKLMTNASNDVQQKMINLSKYLNAYKSIATTLKSNKLFVQLLPEIKEVTLNTTNNPANKKMFKILKKKTFKKDPSIFSNKGNVFAAFKLMQQQKETFIQTMKTIGKVDAYVSMAKLYKEHTNNTNAKYCFVQFEENSDKPHLKIENLWHPFLDPNTVVTNDIQMGKAQIETVNGNNNIILTGPNAAGKSTILKAATICTLMAQTFGISPASSMSLTPFKLIHTYLNITDTTGQESLFQAEMHRTYDLIKMIKNLNDNEFTFIIMDEIFTGTNPKEGSAAAYGIGMRLAEFQNLNCILATHFGQLTHLEQDTSGIFQNYKVTATKKTDGSFSYPYKWEKGISNQKIALDLIDNEGFDPQILHYAYQALGN